MPLPIHACGKYFSFPVFVLVQFHAIDDCSVLQPMQMPPQGLLSLKRANSTFQFSIISKLPTPFSRSLINILNKTIPGGEPWGTVLVTGLQPDSLQPFEPGSSLSSLPTEPCTCSLHSQIACLEERCEGQNQNP